MYLGIDIGGTKTIVAILDDNGVIQESYKFPTAKTYDKFLNDLAIFVDKLSTKEFVTAAAGVPGRLDRTHGIAMAFGNRPWRNVPIQKDIEKIIGCKLAIENDANLAGLSEAMLAKEYSRVLYVTVSTGIGVGFIVNQHLDPGMVDSEGGNILLEHNGKLEPWEDFASGRAIVSRFGKRAKDITDNKTWRIIAHNLAIGLIDLIAVMQPEMIILGGGVGTYYAKYKEYLDKDLKEYENPLLNTPIIREAARPELAVVYGCYDIIKSNYEANTEKN